MTESNEDTIIDLTSSFTLAAHCGLNNVIIDLDTEESFREETNRESNNTQRNRNVTRKRNTRRLTKRRVTNTEPTDSALTLIPDEKVSNKCNRKSKKIHEKSPEEPKEKKAKSIGSCPICLDEFGTKPLSATKCGHVFCADCIKSALKNAATCPQCRTKLRGATAVHPLFLS